MLVSGVQYNDSVFGYLVSFTLSSSHLSPYMVTKFLCFVTCDLSFEGLKGR